MSNSSGAAAVQAGAATGDRHTRIRELFKLIVEADVSATGGDALVRRDALIEAFCLITGQEPETVHEQLGEARQARHDEMLAASEGWEGP